MSQRLSEYDDYDRPYGQFDLGRFEHNLKQILAGRRGQTFLRELEAALLALPEKRLIADAFCQTTVVLDDLSDGPPLMVEGDVCVMGAVALHRGLRWEELELLGAELEWADETPRWASKRFGIPFTLAWAMVDDNDSWSGCSPEDRYQQTLAWVRFHLAASGTR